MRKHKCFQAAFLSMLVALAASAQPPAQDAQTPAPPPAPPPWSLPEALEFLRKESAGHADIRVQDCLARGFDHFCLNRGYERALVTMEEWAKDPNENVRRAVIEAPRPWTKKEYFAANPKIAFAFVASMKADHSGTVRFSVGRALCEMGEDFPDLLLAELKTWNLHHPPVKHTYMFASKYTHTSMGSVFPSNKPPI